MVITFEDACISDKAGWEICVKKCMWGEDRAVYYYVVVCLWNMFCKLLFRCLNAHVGFVS